MLWVKAFHIIAVTCWFAMLFYLPRLFVYHAMADDKTSLDRFKIMERKLYYGIGTPSMVTTIALGIWTTSFNVTYYMNALWFHIKIFMVALLVVYHFACGYFLAKFKHDQNKHSHVFYRVFNEIPVVALIAIVILVVVKQPF